MIFPRSAECSEVGAKVERELKVELKLKLKLKTPSGQVDTNCCKVFWHSSVLMSHDELLWSRRLFGPALFRTPHMN